MQMWNSCNSPLFTEENKIELKRILNKNLPVIESLKDWTKIKKNWPEIILMVDLQEHEQIIQLQWAKIKKKVIDLIVNGGLTSGKINYESRSSFCKSSYAYYRITGN